MIKNTIYFVLILLFFPSGYAQNEGHWDKERATYKEVLVSAGKRVVVKTDDFPTGTTELIYRITLLDEGQNLVNSLVSLLKSIPDPTGISDGSAGAIFILSKIAGTDKCSYSVFTSNEFATKYQADAKTTNACFSQEIPLNKDSKRLTLGKSDCFKATTSNLWFGFESANWIMRQKIIVEVVPWVNIKLSSGWSLENRKSVIDKCKTSTIAKTLARPDEFCICVQEKIQDKFLFTEFQKLLEIEKSKAYKDFSKYCFEELKLSKERDNAIRNQATDFIKNGDYGNAIAKYILLINESNPSALDYNAIGYLYILTKQYSKAIHSLKEAEKRDNAELSIQLNLAHAYLLNDDYKLAKSIYMEYRNQNISDNLSWNQKIKEDFEIFRSKDLNSDYFEKVLKLIER